MTIYDRPVRQLMHDFAKDKLSKGQTFGKAEAVAWFVSKYPAIKKGTVEAHVEAMSANSRSRKHHPNVKPNASWDLFFKVGPGRYRLWDPEEDPGPIYIDDIVDAEAKQAAIGESAEAEEEEREEEAAGTVFAFERDLQNYLARNLEALGPDLRVYEEEGLTGVEYPVGGRYIDILAVDKDDNFVVVELKVSRGYDRTVGQLLRYMGWVRENLADGRKVCGIIVANDITEDLKLAASHLPDVSLVEYEITFRLTPVT